MEGFEGIKCRVRSIIRRRLRKVRLGVAFRADDRTMAFGLMAASLPEKQIYLCRMSSS